MLIGHRGAPRERPENTLPSFLRALELQADGIELDVHCTKDRVVVVHHDEIPRATPPSGQLAGRRIDDAHLRRAPGLFGARPRAHLDARGGARGHQGARGRLHRAEGRGDRARSGRLSFARPSRRIAAPFTASITPRWRAHGRSRRRFVAASSSIAPSPIRLQRCARRMRYDVWPSREHVNESISWRRCTEQEAA